MTAPNDETWTIHGSCLTHRQYEMGCSEFDALRARSAGHCEACGLNAADSKSGRLVIDHDHRYGLGAVRGLLCSSCNILLGAIEAGNTRADAATLLRFDRYLASAWFMQIARWSRLHGPQMNVPGEERALVEAVLRSSFVRPLTAATEQQPEVEMSAMIMPGHLRHRAEIRHKILERKGATVRTVVLCSKRHVISLQSIAYYGPGSTMQFGRAADAAAYVRKVRRGA